METSAGAREELGRPRGARQRVSVSFADRPRLPFGPGGLLALGVAKSGGVADPARGGTRHPLPTLRDKTDGRLPSAVFAVYACRGMPERARNSSGVATAALGRPSFA
jgi:hypothetical protein